MGVPCPTNLAGEENPGCKDTINQHLTVRVLFWTLRGCCFSAPQTSTMKNTQTGRSINMCFFSSQLMLGLPWAFVFCHLKLWEFPRHETFHVFGGYTVTHILIYSWGVKHSFFMEFGVQGGESRWRNSYVNVLVYHGPLLQIATFWLVVDLHNGGKCVFHQKINSQWSQTHWAPHAFLVGGFNPLEKN